MKRNGLCKLLGIEYPIIQAPMNWITGAGLAAAVSNAGGLGTIGPNAGVKTITEDVALTGERLREQIKKVKNITGKPFAVNIAVGTGEALKFSRRCVEVSLEEGVPVAIVSVGPPDVYTRMLKNAGVKVLQAISAPKHARKAEAEGVDGVICEGYEGGGHKGLDELTTFVLVRMVAGTVKIPIVAGGGIVDTRGLVAALSLGADGVYIGTRFMATNESDAHPKVKEAMLRGGETCTASVHKHISGRPPMLGRDLKNHFTQKYLEMTAAGASAGELEAFIQDHAQYHALALGDAENSEIPCGQDAGMIKSILSAGEVIRDIVNGVPAVFDDLKGKLAQ